MDTRPFISGSSTQGITCEGLDLLVVKVVFPQEDLNAGLHAEGAQQQHLNIRI